MIKKIKIIAYTLGLLLCVIPQCGFTQDISQEFNEQLKQASHNNKTIVSRFSQTKKIIGIEKLQQTQGNFYYDKLGDMAMIYDKPMGDKVVMNGDRFTIVVGGKRFESSSSNPMLAQISYMMQASMSGSVDKLGRGWKLSIDTFEGDYRVIVEPTERRISRYITSMTMIFDNQTMTLNELRIDEKQGGYTRYKFFSKEINAEIDSKVFIP